MMFNLRGAALVSAILLGGCGGGGGGGTPTPPATPQALAITEANAKPVAANALDSVQNTSATRSSTSLLTGVQVDSGGATPVAGTFMAMAELARAAAGSATPGAALPTAVMVNQTAACPMGGSMNVSGNMSGMDTMMAGDNLSVSASNCAVSVGGTTAVMNGSMSMTVISGNVSTLPFHVVMAMTASDLSVQSGGTTIVTTGDVRLDWTASSVSMQSMVATGMSMSSRETTGSSTHTTVMQNYMQTLTLNGTTVTCSVSASVQTDSTRLGAGGGTYTISTPTPVMWNSATGVVSAGVVKVVGASGSQLVMTIAADGSVTLQVDANGDGSFEKTLTSTVAELKTLL